MIGSWKRAYLLGGIARRRQNQFTIRVPPESYFHPHLDRNRLPTLLQMAGSKTPGASSLHCFRVGCFVKSTDQLDIANVSRVADHYLQINDTGNCGISSRCSLLWRNTSCSTGLGYISRRRTVPFVLAGGTYRHTQKNDQKKRALVHGEDCKRRDKRSSR